MYINAQLWRVNLYRGGGGGGEFGQIFLMATNLIFYMSKKY